MFGEENEFFTKEELMELADAVADEINAEYGDNDFRYTDVYIDGKNVHIEITTPEGDAYTLSVHIDMRKIKKPSDLFNYTQIFVKQFLNQYQGLEEATCINCADDTEPEYDIFMLMDYYPGDAGMESDDFYCYGKFYARSLEDAQQQLKDCIRKYPDVDADGMYVTEYNEYFDDFDPDDPDDYWANEVFQDLDVMFSKFNQNAQDYAAEYGDEELPFN